MLKKIKDNEDKLRKFSFMNSLTQNTSTIGAVIPVISF